MNNVPTSLVDEVESRYMTEKAWLNTTLFLLSVKNF